MGHEEIFQHAFSLSRLGDRRDKNLADRVAYRCDDYKMESKVYLRLRDFCVFCYVGLLRHFKSFPMKVFLHRFARPVPLRKRLCRARVYT